MQIRATIVGFLKWYKKESSDTTAGYHFTKGGPPDTATKVRVDFGGVEKYLNRFKQSGFVSDAYTDNFRRYFFDVDKRMELMPKTNELIKIEGLDVDLVLQTYEPETILNGIDKCTISKKYQIYNKALVSLYISKHVSVLVILTRLDKKWLIDYLGHDLTDRQSFFSQ